MKKIELTQGKFATVDDGDYEIVSNHKWSFDPKGYAFRNTDKSVPRNQRRIIYLHRQLLDAKKGEYCDHANGDKLDNRRENLRICTNAQNIQNRKIGKNNTSGYKGVFWHNRDKLWFSRLMVNGKSIILKYSKDKKEVARAYNEAAIKYHGEFAKLNTI